MNVMLKLFLASSLITQPFAMAANIDSTSSAVAQQEVNIPVHIRPLADDFIDGFAEEKYLLEDPNSPKVRIHYHYHFEEQQDNVEPEIDCEKLNKKEKKRGKKVREDDDDDYEIDCDTLQLSPPENVLQDFFQEQAPPSEEQSEAPSEAPSASSIMPSAASLVPTGLPSHTDSPTMFPSMYLTNTWPPSMILTSTAVPSQAYASESAEPSLQVPSDSPSDSPTLASNEPSSLETETNNANVYSAKDSKSIGSFWVAAIGICALAFVGGFVSSRLVSKPQASNANNDLEASSIQLSVEDSLDSYCEDWSVSVVSWKPRETAEVQTKGALATDEIEIEFEERDLEGYGNAYGDHYQDEEDPRMFDEIDLHSQSSV